MPIEKKLGAFNILTPKKLAASESASGLELEGYDFTLEKLSTPLSNTEVPYTCISYSWMSEREPNPIYEGQEMSSRSLPALKTAIKALEQYEDSSLKTKSHFPIWIDSFCVPPSGANREKCLRNMGAIYGNAIQVLVVLSSASESVLKQVREDDKIDLETLLHLERDDWPMKAWTYQEIVNSNAIYFIAEGTHEVPVVGHRFFDAVVMAKSELQDAKGYDLHKMNSSYPSLGSFESVILDWRIAGYQKRAAYQVIASIAVRKAAYPDELTFAMIGAISDELHDGEGLLSVSPEEYFLQTCEAKKDFSFIYSTAKRSPIKGKCWRPVAEKIEVVLSGIACTGEGQSGIVYPTHLQLDQICLKKAAKTGDKNVVGLMKFYSIGNENAPRNTWAYLIFEWLKKAGFEGCGQCIELDTGFFFTSDPVSGSDNSTVVISTELKFLFGAPGLIVTGDGTDPYHYRTSGVFFGKLSSSNKTSIDIGL